MYSAFWSRFAVKGSRKRLQSIGRESAICQKKSSKERFEIMFVHWWGRFSAKEIRGNETQSQKEEKAGHQKEQRYITLSNWRENKKVVEVHEG